MKIGSPNWTAYFTILLLCYLQKIIFPVRINTRMLQLIFLIHQLIFGKLTERFFLIKKQPVGCNYRNCCKSWFFYLKFKSIHIKMSVWACRRSYKKTFRQVQYDKLQINHSKIIITPNGLKKQWIHSILQQILAVKISSPYRLLKTSHKDGFNSLFLNQSKCFNLRALSYYNIVYSWSILTS